MGIIRKTLSAGAFMAGVPVIQFRSDTERVAYQVKKLRQSIDAQGQLQETVISGGDSGYVAPPPPPTIDLTAATVVDASVTGTSIFTSRVSESDKSSEGEPPSGSAPGWKVDPHDSAFERFWNGTAWTSMRRNAP